jgi:hypothetical protein
MFGNINLSPQKNNSLKRFQITKYQNNLLIANFLFVDILMGKMKQVHSIQTYQKRIVSFLQKEEEETPSCLTKLKEQVDWLTYDYIDGKLLVCTRDKGTYKTYYYN